jgi:ectoine hydroxylase-related dioxygenase (phytanoyl-CoA dioxygenase family)
VAERACFPQVWELNEVGPQDGGTLFLSGSHKAAFPRPEGHSQPDSKLFDTYSCPAGSAVVFTEALCHTGTAWLGKGERMAVFTCYDAVNSKWGNDNTPIEVIDALCPMRQTLYRDVRATADNKEFKNKNSDRYAAETARL